MFEPGITCQMTVHGFKHCKRGRIISEMFLEDATMGLTGAPGAC